MGKASYAPALVDLLHSRRLTLLVVEHRVKLRSSIRAGFVSFNSLFDSAAPTRTKTNPSIAAY
jgi:hypothetical protein